MRTAALLLSAVVPSGRQLTGDERVPRPEYPQPQFQRADWLTLNGAWQFEFDDHNVGLDESWTTGKPAFGRSIIVPFPFEASRSGIGDTRFHAWVWYRRTFAVSEHWRG